MKNKLYELLREDFTKNQYLRLQIPKSLSLYIGKDSTGRFALEYRGHYNPTRLMSSEVIAVSQSKSSDLYSLCFSLENIDLMEYFCTFCDDLIYSVLDIDDESIAYKILCQRYLSWKKLFRPNQGHLNEKEIMGLIGELLFLKDYMIPRYGLDVSIESWTGPEFSHKDFSVNDEWFEIKTISVGKPAVRISSLEQLDSDVSGTLVVYELERMSPKYNGTCLNNLVSQIMSLMNCIQRSAFMEKLSQFGYDFSLEYNNYIFSISFVNEYKIGLDFPRLKRKDIPKMIQRVQYDIILSEIIQFKISN